MPTTRSKLVFLVIILVLAITTNPCDSVSINKLSTIRHNAANESNYETVVWGNFTNGDQCDAKEGFLCIAKISGNSYNLLIFINYSMRPYYIYRRAKF